MATGFFKALCRRLRRIGDFDIRRRYNGDLERSTDNKTGHYWETGISAGWSFTFCQNWLLELSASCGYLHATVMPYEPNPAESFTKQPVMVSRALTLRA